MHRLLMLAIGIPVLLFLMGCGKQTETIHGHNGSDGVDGVSCYAETVENGTNVVCGDKTSFIPNGVDGKDGADGIDGQDGSFEGYIDYVEVCPDIDGRYKETLLALNGKFMAFLDGGKNDRLAILKEGVMYRTTDGRNVRFSIVEGEIVCL